MTSTAMPTARTRKTRTRTRRVSHRPALKLSELLPSHIDLRDPLKAVLVCPDCGTWCPITGMQSKQQKLVPHHAGRAGVDAAVRCRGSNRLVEWDMTLPEWAQALADAIEATAHRRPTSVVGSDARVSGPVRRGQWAAVAESVRQADALRALRPVGDAPLDSPPVPMDPLHPTR